MVKSWAPEPPEDRDDHLPVLSSEQVIFPQSEDSDEALDHPDPPNGYTLFANANFEGDLSNDDESEEDSDNETSIGLTLNSQNHEANALGSQDGSESHSQIIPALRRSSEVLEVSGLYSSTQPSDIVIDCDEVRAAMATVTLPPSAFPPWAVGVSDSELTNQIQRLLNTQRPSDALLQKKWTDFPASPGGEPAGLDKERLMRMERHHYTMMAT